METNNNHSLEKALLSIEKELHMLNIQIMAIREDEHTEKRQKMHSSFCEKERQEMEQWERRRTRDKLNKWLDKVLDE